MAPIAIKIAGPYTITSEAGRICVNGKLAVMRPAPKGTRNRAGETLTDLVETGDIGANGRPNLVALTAVERDLHVAAVAQLRAAEKATYRASAEGQADATRHAAERAFDQGSNEGGEGYNPHRHGSARTYA